MLHSAAPQAKPADNATVEEVKKLLSSFSIEGVQVNVVDKPYVDPVTSISYSKGVYASGVLSFDKAPLNVIKKILPSGIDKVNIHGLVTKPISNMEFEASIAKGAIKIGAAKMTDLAIHIKPSAKSFGIGGTIVMKVPKGLKAKSDTGVANTIMFKALMAISGTTAAVTGALEGSLDFKGFVVKDVGLEVQVNLIGGEPTAFGIHGDLSIGSFECKFAEMMDMQHPERDRIAGEFKQSALAQFAKVLKDAAAKFEKESGKAISGSEHKADTALNKQIADTQNKIKKQKASLDRDKKKCKKLDVGACARVAQEAAKLAGLETELNAGLKAAKGTAQGVLEASKAGAEGLGEAGKGVAALSKELADIREIKFEASAQDIESGKSPLFSIQGTVFGQKINLTNVQVDFSHPDKLIDGLVKEVMKKIK